jgi:hypothetical protein
MKNTIFILAASFVSVLSHAQSLAPQSVNSGATNMSQSNGSLSFTVGELVVLTQIDDAGNSLSGGFTAGSTLSTVAVKETDARVLDVRVYPNPTTELVNVQLNYTKLDRVRVVVTDLQGKEVYSGTYAGIANVIGIHTAAYAPGTYMLSLLSMDEQLLGTYKIIKQ